MSKKTISRREVILTAGVAVAALSPGINLVDLARSSSRKDASEKLVRWGMLVDTTRCADGCSDCVDACNTEHGLQGGDSPQTDAQYIRVVDLKDRNTGREYSLPLMCQHCESAPCVDVCPTGASFRREDGVVLVDKHTCIGCRYCMLACPYKARSFVHENLTDQVPATPRGKGTVESCNFCTHRVDRGGNPACVEACDQNGHGALVFGDLNDPESELSRQLKEKPSTRIRENLDLNTAVRYHGI